MSVRFRFCQARGWSSRLINLAGGGTRSLGYSHVDIVAPDGWLIGARSDVFVIDGVTYPAGVQRRPAGYNDAELIYHDVFELQSTATQETEFYDVLRRQIGKPYDKLAILAFLDDRDWRDESAWFCDELAAYCTETAGICDKLYLPVNKLNPTTWAVVVSAIGGVKQ